MALVRGTAIALGTRECAQLGFVTPGEVEDGTVVRMQKAYPVYDRWYADSLATLQRYLESFANLLDDRTQWLTSL